MNGLFDGFQSMYQEMNTPEGQQKVRQKLFELGIPEEHVEAFAGSLELISRAYLNQIDPAESITHTLLKGDDSKLRAALALLQALMPKVVMITDSGQQAFATLVVAFTVESLKS